MSHPFVAEPVSPEIPAWLAEIPGDWLVSSPIPLEVDIGCHKGLFLTEMAAQLPDRRFLGVEWQSKRVEKTRAKIAAQGLTNACVIRADGLDFLREMPSAVADHLHVLFPDPWPKRRHHIRRLVQKRFLAECHRVLKSGAILRLVTDDRPYHDAMAALLEEDEIRSQWQILPGEDRSYPVTEFQKKFLAAGLPIHRLLLRRIA